MGAADHPRSRQPVSCARRVLPRPMICTRRGRSPGKPWPRARTAGGYRQRRRGVSRVHRRLLESGTTGRSALPRVAAWPSRASRLGPRDAHPPGGVLSSSRRSSRPSRGHRARAGGGMADAGFPPPTGLKGVRRAGALSAIAAEVIARPPDTGRYDPEAMAEEIGYPMRNGGWSRAGHPDAQRLRVRLAPTPRHRVAQTPSPPCAAPPGRRRGANRAVEGAAALAGDYGMRCERARGAAPEDGDCQGVARRAA